MYCISQVEITAFENDNDALIPELWAAQALRTLGSNLVMGSLVNRDFSERVANFGDVVNTSRPADFSGKRKTDVDSVTVQDAVSPNIQVPLDQHLHVTFVIKDGEMSKALPDLVERYLEPAARELAEKVDQVLCGQAARLATTAVGRLGEMDATTAAKFMLDAHTQMQVNKAPKVGRNLVLSPLAENAALSAEIVVSAEKRGDEGTALREASIGRIYGFDTYMDQNVSGVNVGGADVALGVTDGAEVAGATAIETTVAHSSLVATGGEYVVFEGEGKAHRIASSSTGGTDADLVLTEGLVNGIGSGADVTVYLAGAVAGTEDTNLTGVNYPADWAKEIRIDGFASGKELQVGQWVTFGTGVNSHSYSVIAASIPTAGVSYVLLDRPLDTGLTDNQLVFPGPAGTFNLAFHRDAIALVSRPLARAPEGTGARSAVASYGDLSMRVTMAYDPYAQGLVVTFDLLCGTAILDERLAVVVYG